MRLLNGLENVVCLGKLFAHAECTNQVLQRNNATDLLKKFSNVSLTEIERAKIIFIIRLVI